jgi:hypothetical protein
MVNIRAETKNNLKWQRKETKLLQNNKNRKKNKLSITETIKENISSICSDLGRFYLNLMSSEFVRSARGLNFVVPQG